MYVESRTRFVVTGYIEIQASIRPAEQVVQGVYTVILNIIHKLGYYATVRICSYIQRLALITSISANRICEYPLTSEFQSCT